MSAPAVLSAHDIEARVGVASLDVLHAERRALIAQVAPLRALYGPFGAWDAKRKVLLALCATTIREEAETKLTEAAVNDLAHSASLYREFIDRSVSEREEYIVLENAITDITERIHRDNALIRYVTSEPK